MAGGELGDVAAQPLKVIVPTQQVLSKMNQTPPVVSGYPLGLMRIFEDPGLFVSVPVALRGGGGGVGDFPPWVRPGGCDGWPLPSACVRWEPRS